MKFEMSIQEKNLILGLIVCAIIITVGSSFAYFSTGITFNNENNPSVSGTTAVLPKVTYTPEADDSSITLDNVIPGTKITKKFKVKVEDATENVKYAIILNISNNTFKKCTKTGEEVTYNDNTNKCDENAQELKYTLKKGEEEQQSGYLTEGQTGKVTVATISSGNTTGDGDEYELDIEYVETGSDQNHNEGATLSLSVEVEFAE